MWKLYIVTMTAQDPCIAKHLYYLQELRTDSLQMLSVGWKKVFTALASLARMTIRMPQAVPGWMTRITKMQEVQVMRNHSCKTRFQENERRGTGTQAEKWELSNRAGTVTGWISHHILPSMSIFGFN